MGIQNWKQHLAVAGFATSWPASEQVGNLRKMPNFWPFGFMHHEGITLELTSREGGQLGFLKLEMLRWGTSFTITPTAPRIEDPIPASALFRESKIDDQLGSPE